MSGNPELYDLGHVVILEKEGMYLMSYQELIDIAQSNDGNNAY
jgi:hypothetical protein